MSEGYTSSVQTTLQSEQLRETGYNYYPHDRCHQRRRRRKRRSYGKDVVSMDHFEDECDFDSLQYLNASQHSNTNRNSTKLSGITVHPIPFLLFEREVCGNRRLLRKYRRQPWTTCILQKEIYPPNSCSTKTWRPFCTRSLKFSQLRTSPMDAVIGIDPTGSYIVAIGDCNVSSNDNVQSLVLRFRGIPNRGSKIPVEAPILLSIPLDEPSTTYPDDDDSVIDFSWLCILAHIPVRVWLCSDGRFGACMYRSTKTNGFNATVSVVVFPQPRAWTKQENGLTFNKLNHVHVPCQAKQDLSPCADCNLLVCTNFAPKRQSSNTSTLNAIDKIWICDTVLTGYPSYLFLIDEEDGFRLTWFSESYLQSRIDQCEQVRSIWQQGDDYNSNMLNPNKWKPVTVYSSMDSRIVVPVSDIDSGWETVTCDSMGLPSSNDNKIIDPIFKVVFTGFFSVASLLLNILNRRPHLVKPRFSNSGADLPHFSYYVVQIKDGRIVEILLVFSIGTVGHGCLGVFVEVDLLTQDYREMEWIRHETSDTPPSSCGKLALDRRRSQCFHKDDNIDEYNHDAVLEVVYPDCLTMDNLAVRRQTPVKSLSARSAPLNISYC